MRISRVLTICGLALALCGSFAAPALAGCSVGIPITQWQKGRGNFIVNPSKQYGGWFWMVGRGNNLINLGGRGLEAGHDSGRLGGVPAEWLIDLRGHGASRAVEWNWNSWQYV